MISNNTDIFTGAADVADRIRKYIRDRRLDVGDRLPTHADLARRLRIGSRRLREGLSILQQQGLVQPHGRAGTLVAEPPVAALDAPIAWQLDHQGCSVEQLIIARARIESAIVAEACAHRVARDLLTMHDAIDEMEQLTQRGESDDEPDQRFHLAVLAAAHNPALLMFGQLICSQFRRKLSDRIASTLDHQKKAIGEHRRLVAAIDKRCADVACQIMHTHIARQIAAIATDIAPPAGPAAPPRRKS
jgi:GntR family transcriptional repressor for pyruvate dehydrogenase complex